MTNFAKKGGFRKMPEALAQIKTTTDPTAPASAINVQDIRQEVEQLLDHPDYYREEENKGLFLVRTADRWIEQSKKHPIPRMLFSEFWFEGELCILFADTNLGKSILAVQIGNSISRGEAIPGFKLQSQAQPIIYFDFELSVKQFEARYSCDYTNHYTFDANFYRAEINPDADLPTANGKFEDFLNESLEQTVIDTEARVLIIDNLTYLKNETEQARNALPLMKHLKSLKQRYGLSILALAHTPKRDASKPISRNDLQGSKMLMNFCDSAFSIGESYTDKNIRYLKQIKQRETESIYDSDNVIVCQTCKPENFLQFEFLNFGTEWEHLKRLTEDEKNELEQKVREIMDAEPEVPVFTIARRLCTDETKFNSFRVKVNRIVNKIRNAA
jgi:AAA domain-containing protein